MLKNVKKLLVATACLAAVSAVGCVSEKSTPAAPVRDAAFLGYSVPDTKQTTCGNCHVDVQAEWAQTKHASAWADLQASGHAQPFCNKCHTTNGATTEPAADTLGFFAATTDAAKKLYQDVQCESCHGPGANHVSAPSETQPLPSMLVDTSHADGCAACHNGTRNSFTEQLGASKHGRMPNWYGPGNSHADCQVACHNGFGAIRTMNPRGAGIYKNVVAPVNYLTPNPGLTCVVCHDPHDDTNMPQLRLTLTATDSAQHECGKCHSHAGPTASTWKSFRGGHGVQFPTLQGYAGYIDPSYGNITGPARHGTQEGSCPTCHMASGPVNTAAGAFAVQNTGHTFEVLPCLNPAATATGGVDTSAACTDAQRSFAACATSNCHGSEASARTAMERLQTEIKGYINVLWVDGNGNNYVDPYPTDSGWLPKLMLHDATRAVGTRRLATTGADTVFTVAKGARYNALTFGSANRHGDGSFGVHNPGFVRALLQQTILQMRNAYAVTDTLQGVPPAVQAQLARASRH